jgi:hypothetical protein
MDYNYQNFHFKDTQLDCSNLNGQQKILLLFWQSSKPIKKLSLASICYHLGSLCMNTMISVVATFSLSFGLYFKSIIIIIYNHNDSMIIYPVL